MVYFVRRECVKFTFNFCCTVFSFQGTTRINNTVQAEQGEYVVLFTFNYSITQRYSNVKRNFTKNYTNFDSFFV